MGKLSLQIVLRIIVEFQPLVVLDLDELNKIRGVVPHALDVIDCMHQGHDTRALRLGEIVFSDLREVPGDLLLHGIHQFLVAEHDLQEVYPVLEEGDPAVVHHLVGNVPHAVEFLRRLGKSYGRRRKYPIVNELDDPCLDFLLRGRQEPHDQFLERVDENQGDDCHEHVEHRVRVGHLVRKRRRRQFHELGKRFEEWKHDDCAYEVEQEVRECRSSAGNVGTETGKPRGHSRPDIGSQDQGDRGRQRDHPFHRQGDDQASAHRRTLDERRENGSGANTKDGDLAKPYQEVNEALTVLERCKGVRHEVEDEEQDAEAKDSLADSLAGLALDEKLHHDAYQHEEPHEFIQLEHDNLGCDGRADVGTEDDTHGLPQCHQPSVGKPNDHDRRGSAALDDASDHHTDQHPADWFVRESLQDASERVPGCFLKAVPEEFHTIQEEGQPNDEIHG